MSRLETVKAQIAALDQCLLEFAQDSGKQTVSMDTGQTRISYTRSDIGTIQRTKAALLNELAVLEVRTGQARGGFYGRHV